MKRPDFYTLVLLVLLSSVMLVLGLYLLANFSKLFRGIRNSLLRKNIVVWMIAVCLILAVLPTNPDFSQAIYTGKWFRLLLLQVVGITVLAFFVFNITFYISQGKALQRKSFKKRMGIILATIIICTMVTSIPINFWANHGSFKNVEYTILFNFYTGCMTGLIFITMSYVDLERNRKLNEKELEVSRLQGLKTKAELEALHSKINPHFLYNALNSIADLSITDGKKARKMTVALADLFRFSINYSDHNYSTIREEVEMAEVYLQIEKIRFEDQLTYTVNVDPELEHFLVPRFVLQPIVENAVKHGLKATGRMTQITLEVKKENEFLVMEVADNGPPFPVEINPGYGVKSMFDKMDLLFPETYEIRFTNEPRKQVSVHIRKMIKNEPAL